MTSCGRRGGYTSRQAKVSRQVSRHKVGVSSGRRNESRDREARKAFEILRNSREERRIYSFLYGDESKATRGETRERRYQDSRRERGRRRREPLEGPRTRGRVAVGRADSGAAALAHGNPQYFHYPSNRRDMYSSLKAPPC